MNASEEVVDLRWLIGDWRSRSLGYDYRGMGKRAQVNNCWSKN